MRPDKIRSVASQVEMGTIIECSFNGMASSHHPKCFVCTDGTKKYFGGVERAFPEEWACFGHGL
eukprot:1990985-Amphidinium_carterae.1